MLVSKWLACPNFIIKCISNVGIDGEDIALSGAEAPPPGRCSGDGSVIISFLFMIREADPRSFIRWMHVSIVYL